MHGGRRTIPCVLAVAAALGGCGGPIRADELRRGVESLQSTAADGRLLAQQVVAGRSRDPFTRVHARMLGERATHEAEKLGDATATGPLAARKRQATQLAQDIAGALSDLQVAPGDGAVARHTEAQLRHATTNAGDLADRL
jgi:hypothetical protein